MSPDVSGPGDILVFMLDGHLSPPHCLAILLKLPSYTLLHTCIGPRDLTGASRFVPDAPLSPQHPESALPLRHICKMILGALPHRLEDERFGQEELDIVVCPGMGREALEEHDHLLCWVSYVLSDTSAPDWYTRSPSVPHYAWRRVPGG